MGRLISGHAYIKWYRSPEYYSDSPWKGTLRGDGWCSFNKSRHPYGGLVARCDGRYFRSLCKKWATNLHNIEGEDLAQGLLTFTNGAMGTIVASTALWPGYPERLEVYGELGSICLEGGKIASWNIMDEDPPIQMTKPR